MKTIAIGGMGKLGEHIIRYLTNYPGVMLVGVDSDTDREGQTNLLRVARYCNIPVLTYEEIVDRKPDIFFSISYLKKIKKELLDNSLCINLHVAKLPEYKGRSVYSHAIMNKEPYYYTTMHLMTEKIDAGDIIAERKVEIGGHITAKQLHEMMRGVSFCMFMETLPSILNGSFKRRKQEGISRYYGKELNKELTMTENAVDLYNKVRALDFPPYEPAYYMRNGTKIYVKMEDITLDKYNLYVHGILYQPGCWNKYQI